MDEIELILRELTGYIHETTNSLLKIEKSLKKIEEKLGIEGEEDV